MIMTTPYSTDQLAALAANWPGLGQGNHSAASQKLDATISKLIATVSMLLTRVSVLETENITLKANLFQQPKSASPSLTTTLNWASAVKHGSEANKAIITAVNENAKIVETKSKRAIVIGLPKSFDNNQRLISVQSMLKKLNYNVAFKVVGHFTKKINNTTSLTTIAPEPNELIIIEFDSNEHRNDLLSNAKRLASIDELKSVYIRPDRTPLEQETFNNLNKKRATENAELLAKDLLDKPFRFVIRSEKIKCIDTSKTVNINGREKNPFLKWKSAAEAIQSLSTSH